MRGQERLSNATHRTHRSSCVLLRSLPLLVPACLLLDGPADLPQMLPEGV